MKKLFLIGAGLGLLGFLGSFLVLFLGPSFQMARANQALAICDIRKAQQFYRTLEGSSPRLPQVSYNLGLCNYQLREFQTARRNFEQALRNIAVSSKNGYSKEQRLLSGMARYHLGNIAFKSASTVKDEHSKVKLYQEALACYKKALQANPNDLEAKYNYELVMLRLTQSNQGGAAVQQPNEALNQTASQSEEYLNQSTPGELIPEGKDW